MSELTDCLQTDVPKVFQFPAGIAHPSNPVAWALELFAASLREAEWRLATSRIMYKGPYPERV